MLFLLIIGIIALSIYLDRQHDAAKFNLALGIVMTYGAVYYFRGFFKGAKWPNLSGGLRKAIPCSRVSLVILTLFFGTYAALSYATGFHYHTREIINYSVPIYTLLLLVCRFRDSLLLEKKDNLDVRPMSRS